MSVWIVVLVVMNFCLVVANLVLLSRKTAKPSIRVGDYPHSIEIQGYSPKQALRLLHLAQRSER